MFSKIKQISDAVKMQKALAKIEATGMSSGGGITVKMNGTFQLSSVTIDSTLLAASDANKVATAVKDAVNNATVGVMKELEKNKDTLVAAMQ